MCSPPGGPWWTSPNTSLPRQLRYALGLADQATGAHHPDVRLSASVLRRALEDLAVVLDERFLRTARGPDRVFAAYAAGHGNPRGRTALPRTAAAGDPERGGRRSNAREGDER
ncbi:hypothetical protein OG361_35095 [Streptomyces sp. NBC_00090]